MILLLQNSSRPCTIRRPTTRQRRTALSPAPSVARAHRGSATEGRASCTPSGAVRAAKTARWMGAWQGACTKEGAPPRGRGRGLRTGRSAPAQESGTTAPPTVPASASACRGRPASDRVSGGGGDGERTPQGGGGRERRGDGPQKTKTIAGCHNGEGGSERRWWGASRCRPGPTRSRSCRNGDVFHPPTAVGPALPRARCSRCPGMWAKEGGGTGCVKARERAYSRVRRLL